MLRMTLTTRDAVQPAALYTDSYDIGSKASVHSVLKQVLVCRQVKGELKKCLGELVYEAELNGTLGTFEVEEGEVRLSFAEVKSAKQSLPMSNGKKKNDGTQKRVSA